MDEVKRMFEWLSNICLSIVLRVPYVDEVVKVFPTKLCYNLRLLICKLLKNVVQIRIRGWTPFHKLGKIAIKIFRTTTDWISNSGLWQQQLSLQGPHSQIFESQGTLIAVGFRFKEEVLM